MHHKLDIHPIPENVLYVNELSLAGKMPYETKKDYEEALSGKRKAEGGILPDDNVRIYVPMDLNLENIMWQLRSVYELLGYPTESNEFLYSIEVRKLISQLEIYDQVCVTRKVGQVVQKEDGGVRHSQQGIKLARKMIEYLEDNEGSAECFPYDEVEELKKMFWLA